MIDFYVVNINPITKSVVEKLQFKSKKISIHPEDTFHDIKNKIWILHGIPPYRQFLFSPQGFTLQDVYVNDIIVPCDINDWFTKNDNDVVLSDIPINKYITENKEHIRIDTSKEYFTIGSTKFLYMVDLDTILTKTRIQDLNIKQETFKFDIVFYGFVVMFWSLNHNNFKYYIKGQINELTDYTREEIEAIYVKQDKYITSLPKKDEKSSIVVLNEVIDIDIGVRNINIRNILDWINTDNNVPAIIAFINDNLEGRLVIKKHTSSGDLVNKIINRRALLKVTKNTQPNIAFIIRKPPNNFIIFTINENGIGSNIYIEYNEDEKIKVEDNYNIISNLTKSIIKRINKELHVLALPDGGSMNMFSQNNILNQQLHICTYWNKSLSMKSFLGLKEAFEKFNETHILEVKPDECSHNDYHNDNCFLLQFRKGMSKCEGYEIKMQLRTTDVKIDVSKIASIKEFKIIQRYLFAFLNEQKISKNDSLDLTKVTLKALHEKDPALYDIKRYNRKAKVYSVLCQSDRQPILYTEEEHKLLPSSRKTTKYWNFTYNKPAYYECPNKKYPHLSFKVGKHPKNFCLPCCKKSEKSRSEIDEKCLKEHTVYEETNETNYTLTYGKPIPLGRISKISESLFLKISESTSNLCSLCNYVLYGVEQDLPGLTDCGLIFSILQSIATNMSVEEVITNITEHILSYGSSYTIIGDGAAQVFDSPEHLIDTILSIFLYKNMDLSVLEDVNEWNKIFMYLVKDVYNIETIIWKELVPNDVTLNISSDFVVDDNIKNLVVVQNKNGYYPIFITDGQVKQGNQFPVFTSMLDTDNTSAVSIINDLILVLSKNIKTNKGINQLCVLDTIFHSTDKWTVELKLLDSRNLCYGIIAYRTTDHEYIYIPIYYTSAGKYLKDVAISHDTKPDHSYKQSTLKDFIQDFNGLSDKTVCNSMNITVDSLVQTYDSPPKYVGFQLDRLIYYHDPEIEPIMKCESSCKTKRILYNPILVDKSMNQHDIMLTPTAYRAEINQTEYRNRLYKLFVSEFLYFLRQEKNKIIRSKLHKLIATSNFNIAKDINNIFASIDSLKNNDDNKLSYNDRYLLKKIISELKDSHKIKQNIDNTVFEFDQTIINELSKKDINVIQSEIEKIMKSIVILIDIKEIDESFNLDNMYSPCQADENGTYKYCKSRKLKVDKNMFNDYVNILSADIHNSTVLNVSNVFDTSEFIKHKGESIVIYKK